MYRFEDFKKDKPILDNRMARDINAIAEPECPKTPLFYPAILPIALLSRNAQNRYLGLLPNQKDYYQIIEENISMLFIQHSTLIKMHFLNLKLYLT